MALRNFDTLLDERGVTRARVEHTEPLVITEQVIVRPSTKRTHLSAVRWGWEELRDYVVAEVEARYGPFPRNPLKEAGVFKGFLNRWGSERAEAIARYAFEHCDGWWAGAHITINRFCAGSDPYFAQVIAERLDRSSVQ